MMLANTQNEFNFFRLFGFEKDEVKHSLFIAELLSPIGMHFQGTKFLELFIETLRVEGKIDGTFPFDVDTAQIEVEKAIGDLGRIDILLCDSKKNYIVIENKIDAPLREAQLGRYLSFAQKNAVSYRILFLTPEGKPPIEGDVGLNMPDDKLEKVCPSDFECISYKCTILNWLHKCYYAVQDNICVQQAVSQYISILKREVLEIEENIFSHLSGEKF
ncbi:MAG: PD-(D/E)XK nuclease family protein [Bacteroidales bacterium]|nr:PD-(D/E)XK nuclease family protein [Bacteroidales bacterium]